MHATTANDTLKIFGKSISFRGLVVRHWANTSMLLGCALLFSWLALVCGRDVPWDYFNYHAYAVELLSHDRLAHDFFAAGMMGYLNPIGFIPLALTQHWQLGSMSTAVVLASLHSLNAFFLYLICRDLVTGRPLPTKIAMALGWLLGASTPVFLIHVGSTGVDPIGSVLVMAAAWLAIFRRQPRYILLAGVLAGISMAVKLSNIGFALAIAITIALPLHEETLRQWCKRVGSGAVGMLGGFCLAQGWWSWRLQETVGNPLFPFFNNIFHSPYLSTDGGVTLRFIPSSLTELATLPYRLALSKPWMYLELSAPTVVPLAACLAALGLCISYLFKSFGQRPRFSAPSTGQRLCVLVVVAATCWVATSTNGRYGIALFMLLGPVLAIALLRGLPQRYAVLVLALLGALQIYTVGFIGIERWNSSQWTPQLLSVEIPEPLKKDPQLFLSISSPSHSEIIPYLHPDSVFVNVRGAYSIPSAGRSHEKLNALISQYGNRTQIVFMIEAQKVKGFDTDVEAVKRHSNAIIDRLGLRLLPDQCSMIRIDNQRALETRFNRRLGPPVEFELLSCSAVKTTPNPELATFRARATQIMDAFEAKCPDLFRPSKPQIEGAGKGWVRKYFNHDSIGLVVSFDKDMLFYGLSGQTSPTFIGKASDWKTVVAGFRCEVPGKGKRGIDYFNEYEKDSIWF